MGPDFYFKYLCMDFFVQESDQEEVIVEMIHAIEVGLKEFVDFPKISQTQTSHVINHVVLGLEEVEYNAKIDMLPYILTNFGKTWTNAQFTRL